MSPHFKPGAVKRTEARMRSRIQEALGRLEGKERCDFVDAVSAPISLAGLTQLLGVPDKHSRRFYRWTNDLIRPDSVRASSGYRTSGIREAKTTPA